MSYKGLMAHRCTILRQDIDLMSGSPVYQWTEVKTNVPCFLDLNFIRNGKDPVWTPEAGRPTERAGVGFFLPKAGLQIGDWVKVTRGPTGIFELGGAIDEAWTPKKLHHLEVSVKEIPAPFAAGQEGASFEPGTYVPVPTELIPIPSPTDTGSL